MASGQQVLYSQIAVDRAAGKYAPSDATSSVGTAITGNTINVTANNAEELVASLNDYARRNGGLRVPGGVTAVS
jgi:hypothetical protein